MSSNAEYVPVPRSSPLVPAEEQARRQGVAPISSVEELAYPGVWESDEELDDFLADLYASRPGELFVSLIVMDTDVASASLLDRLPDRLPARLAGHITTER